MSGLKRIVARWEVFLLLVLVVTFVGPFPSESFIIGRLVGPSEYQASVRWQDRDQPKPGDWYYVRVTQHNGHMAWSSPIWVG